jgi:protein-tyrosine phosphatase
VQVTAGSMLGVFGPGVKHRAERMLRNGWIHILASDAHDASERSPAMGHALRVLGDFVGVEEAEKPG